MAAVSLMVVKGRSVNSWKELLEENENEEKVDDGQGDKS